MKSVRRQKSLPSKCANAQRVLNTVDNLSGFLGLTSSLQKSYEPRPRSWPSTRRSIEVRKHKFSTPFIIRHNEYCNHDNDDRSASPVNADLVNEIQILRAEHINTKHHAHHCPKTQHDLPLRRNIFLVPQRNRAENQLRSREVDGKSDSPVPDKCQPSRDPRNDGSVFPGAEHGRPVVDAAGGRKDGADFREGGGDHEGDDGDEYPAVEDGDGLAVCERVGEGGA